jgi:adenine-specific DNA-methyltransferase
VVRVTNLWNDVRAGGYGEAKIYVVQTNVDVIARCILMATDPGDLVLDPTCGSGTTGYVAEYWGRRWITMDTSRVALALARQRLMTAKFDYFDLRPLNDEDRRRNPKGPWLKDEKVPEGTQRAGAGGKAMTLDCETVPHVTLKSIAQNSALDSIFAKHQPTLDEKLKTLNGAVVNVGKEARQKLAAKLVAKQKAEGKKAVTEADRRRWLLPPANRDPKVKLSVDADFSGWYEWEVPFDTDADWPNDLQAALIEYRAAWRAKMDAVNAAIAANAENEELVDKPRVRKTSRACARTWCGFPAPSRWKR